MTIFLGEGSMKNLEKYMLVILILSLISVGCDSQSKNTNEKDLEVIETNDSISDESQDPYLIKLDAIANDIIDSEEGESVQEILNQAYSKYGDQVENIYYGGKNGKMMLSPPLQLPEDYDARQRIWYKKALDRELFQPEPYQDKSVQKNIQTIAKALYKDDELIGVIGMDYVIKDSEMIDDSEDINISNDDDLKLPLEKRVELKKYVEDLRKVVEDEEDIDALKNFFNEEIENTKVQIETIYLANKNEIYLITPYVQLPDNYDPNVRPWYESAIKENIYISDTYVDRESNRTIVTVSAKIELGDNSIGVLGIDFVIEL